MIRIVLENVLLFFLPTLVYLAYVALTREKAPAGADGTATPGRQQGLLDDAPLLYLFAAGVALVLATLVFFGSTSGGKPDQVYHPPVIKDGRVEPGRIE